MHIPLGEKLFVYAFSFNMLSIERKNTILERIKLQLFIPPGDTSIFERIKLQLIIPLGENRFLNA